MAVAQVVETVMAVTCSNERECHHPCRIGVLADFLLWQGQGWKKQARTRSLVLYVFSFCNNIALILSNSCRQLISTSIISCHPRTMTKVFRNISSCTCQMQSHN